MNTKTMTISFESGASNESMARTLRMQAGLLEGLTGKEAASDKNTTTPAAAKPSKKKAPPPVAEDEAEEDTEEEAISEEFETDEDEEGESFDEASDEEAEEEEEKPAPKKAVKTSYKDVVAAAKAAMAKTTREKVLKHLKAKYKQASIKDVPEAKWPTLLKELKAMK